MGRSTAWAAPGSAAQGPRAFKRSRRRAGAGEVRGRRAGLLGGRRATCFPGFEAQLLGATVSAEAVVEDGDVITSRGPGTALAFALALVARLQGAPQADKIRASMLA